MNPAIMQLMSGGRPSSAFDLGVVAAAQYEPQSLDELLAVIDKVFDRVEQMNKAGRDYHIEHHRVQQEAAERMAAMLEGDNPQLKELEVAAKNATEKNERLEQILSALREEFPERVDALLAAQTTPLEA